MNASRMRLSSDGHFSGAQPRGARNCSPTAIGSASSGVPMVRSSG